MAKTRVNVYQLEPADANGKILKTVGGIAVWASDNSLLAENIGDEEEFFGDGAATQFTLASGPVLATLKVYVDGIRQHQGAAFDYVASTNGVVQFNAGNIPEATQTILVDYRINI